MSAGYLQNPISVYYCHPSDGSKVEKAIAEVGGHAWAGAGGAAHLSHRRISAAVMQNAEPQPRPGTGMQVTNTPWAERVTFVFRPEGETVSKALHVSPLMDMEGTW